MFGVDSLLLMSNEIIPALTKMNVLLLVLLV